MDKKKVIIIVVSVIVAVILMSIIGVMIWYNVGKQSVKKQAGDIIRIEVKEGSSSSAIAEILEENNVIKSANVMKIYAKLNDVKKLQKGKYDLDNSEDLQTIISHIENGEVVNEEIKLTIIEGKNMRSIAKTIADNTKNTEEDVFNLLENEEYIDSLIEKYWFLTDDIKNEDIYYPLEGYLLPDTYIFENREVSVETIFNVILNYMDKFLTEHKEDIKDNLPEILTLASMAELEGVKYEDRQEIVGVFMNRLQKKMPMGSDVTTYYAFKVNMGDRDLTAKEINTYNPYNTRGPNMEGKLPIGPVCNPSKEAIEAVLNYKETDNLYFVADKTNKAYFAKTYKEHLEIIDKLKKEGLWYEYN